MKLAMDQQSPNPAVLSPATRFKAQDYCSNSRSPSRSPHRRQQFTSTEIDPLISNLSPSSTLDALRATEALPNGSGHRTRLISESIADASTSERALGIRAALAAKKLREWHTEVKAWQWPESKFEKPDARERQTYTREHNGCLNQVLVDDNGSLVVGEGGEETVYFGSLPADIVQNYEDRIEVIRDNMEALDVEELKDHVRGAHLLPRSRSSSLEERVDAPATTHNSLDDFTVVITATIMHALPWIMRLNNLLDVWFIRLLVLRQTPGFLRQLEDTQTAMKSAQRAIGQSYDSDAGVESDLTRTAFLTMKSVLQEKVGDLGRRLDAMLDSLEGTEDTIPDHWIDDMEGIQDSYEVWVVDAGRLVDQNEWRLQRERVEKTTRANGSSESNMREYASLVTPSADGLSASPPGNSKVAPELSPNPKAAKDAEQQILHAIVKAQSPKPISAKPLDLSKSAGDTEPLIVTSGTESLFQKEVQGVDGPAAVPGGILAEDRIQWSKSHRPEPLNLKTRGHQTYDSISSDASFSGSTTSDCFSNMSSPEILDASRVEYFKTTLEDKPLFWSPNEVQSPGEVLSRRSSQRTERSISTVKENPATSALGSANVPRSRASSFVPERTIPEDPGSPRRESEGNVHPRPKVQLKRASSTSIEVLPRSEVRNITITRSASCSSPTSQMPAGVGSNKLRWPFQLPSEQISSATNDGISPTFALQNSPPMSDEDQDQSPSVRANNNKQSSARRVSDTDANLSRSKRTLSPNISDAASRRRLLFGPTNSPLRDAVRSPKPGESRRSPLPSTPNSAKSIDDQLAARIISLLEDLPARIQLTSGPDPDAPEVKLPNSVIGLNNGHSSSSPVYPSRSQPSTPLLRLAPAYSRSSKSKSTNNDSDVKLYHLHRPGKDAPIKLHVRLVGENGERVMVRVGGGWADLGEYLKEYASHHGRRSVSDGKFEIKGLPTGQSSSSVTTLANFASGRSTPTSRPGSPTLRPPPQRPESAFNIKKIRRSLGSSTDVQNPSTPDPAARSHDATPGSTDSSTPSLRSSSRMSWIDDATLGLAGPKTRRTDVSPNKQAWVDGMLDQARKASTERKKSTGSGDFGYMGKVGQTRRVFFKAKAED